MIKLEINLEKVKDIVIRKNSVQLLGIGNINGLKTNDFVIKTITPSILKQYTFKDPELEEKKNRALKFLGAWFSYKFKTLIYF